MPKSLVISRRGGEGANESLREFHVKEALLARLSAGGEDEKNQHFAKPKGSCKAASA